MTKRMQRDRARKRLSNLLAIADDAEFFQMIWCANRIQAGKFELGQQGLRDLPAGLAEKVQSDKLHFQPWILEDLINELLAVAKPKRPPPRRMSCESYFGFASAYNAMLEVDDAESGFEIERGQDILQLMPRFAHRQFDWQHGWLNPPLLYRSAFIYGQGDCEDWYLENHGISPAQLMLFGVAAMTSFSRAPGVEWPNLRVPDVGISLKVVAAALKLMCIPLAEARSEAARLRRNLTNMTAKPSVLRRTPMIAFGQHIRVPLPELLMERVTTGLYLDLVKAPSGIRNTIGQRYEQYCLDILQATFSKNARGEYEYGPKGRLIKSPDVLVGASDRLELIVECKATRMSFEVRFSDAWHEATERGYRELAKGVGQVWRYCSHMRRGIVNDRASGSLTGLILTMDPWMRMTQGQDEVVFRMAREWCAETDDQITSDDECPIGFIHINDLETLLHRTDEAGVLTVLRSIAAKVGWGANELVREAEVVEVRRPYFFKDRLGEVLPWFDALGERPRIRAIPEAPQ